MLSLKECKQILDDDSISDVELEEIRQCFYGLAQLTSIQNFPEVVLNEEFEERAAIIEYDAGKPRFEAEMTAMDFQKKRLQ